MKTFHRFCLPFVALALLLTVEKTAAQETFAPLLTKDTVAFVHIDFSKVDVDLLKTEAGKLGETLLTNLGFDARSHRTTMRDLEVELEKLDAMIRPAFERITKELGIKEIALIYDEPLMNEHGIPFLTAVSWKGKTDEDINTLYSLLPEESYWASLEFLPAGDLLIAYDTALLVADGVRLTHENIDEINKEAKRRQAERRQFLADWVKNAAADNTSPMLQALQSLNKSDEIKAVVRVPAVIKQALQNAPFPEEMPIQIRNLLLFAANKIEWAAVSVPVSELLTGTEPKDWRAITVKMPNAEDAKMLREMMVSAIDGGTAAAQLQTQENGGEIPPLLFEFMKGYLRTWLPDVEGDKLYLQWKTDRLTSGLGQWGMGYMALISFLMPAVRVVERPLPMAVPVQQW